jgi:autotransporter translocation and assembly factor TamB
MSPLRHIQRLAVLLAKALIYGTAAILIVVGIAIGVIETGWAKNRIRNFIVRQANQYLTATLEIGRLEGSLFRGITLGDIRLSREGRTLIAIDDVSLNYSLRELFQPGVVIREMRLARPRVTIARTPEGKWDITELVKHDAHEQTRSGPGRPIEIDKIAVFDGDVELHDPLDFGAVHAPTIYRKLNFTGAFVYAPVKWQLTFATMSWIGSAPDLTVNSITGGLDNGPGGTVFHDFAVQTPTTTFTLTGDVVRGDAPTTLDLHVHAARFAFQEWAGVLHGLKNIAVDAAFDTTLRGPLARLDTTLALKSTGGSVGGTLVLDTTVPGWHGAGTVDVGRLNLARWLNREDWPSDISGRVTFDLALELGGRFPRGSYRFSGPHADYLHYAGDEVRARGVITAREVLVTSATARAYGADVTLTAGSIGIDEPFPFHFQGTTSDLDLRRVPETVPVPRVESVLTLDYDVTGQFSNAFIKGHALFGRSQFLGALVDAGTVGTIDTSAKPLRFTGDGTVRDLDLPRLGAGLDVAWLQEPRYAGRVAGHFWVEGAGADRESLVLTAGGRLDRADLFHGRLSAAAVTLAISGGTLTAAYNGQLSTIDPAVALDDGRFAASLTGAANVRTTVRDLLTRTPEAADYDIDGALDLTASSVRGIDLTGAHIDGQFRDAKAELQNIAVSGPAIDGRGSGTIAFAADRTSDFQYDIAQAELSHLTSLTGQNAAGQLSTKGRLTGPWTALRLAGDASVGQVSSGGVTALTANGQYDVTIPSGDAAHATASVTGRAEFLTLFGQAVTQASGTLTLADERLGFDTRLSLAAGRSGGLAGAVVLHPDRRQIDIAELAATFDQAPWRLTIGSALPSIAWSDQGITVSPLQFVGGTSRDQTIDVAGTWRQDGNGALRVTATHVFLETLQGAFEQPARYGGVVDLDATIRGTRDAPIVSGRITISNGRVRRFVYQKLAGRIDVADRMFTVDLRLDQAPGVWINAAGTVPLGLLTHDVPERPIDLAVTSSPIGLGLLEGLTDVVRQVSGEMRLDVKAIGTSRDPHFQGAIDLADAAFVVSATGSQYKHGQATLRLARDRVGIDVLHIEDSAGHPLDAHGSLGTHELSVGDLEIDATARRFEVLHNGFGRVDVDASLQLRGTFEAARINGDITIDSGDLKVDEILDRLLFQPYATEQVSMTPVETVDAIAALNPWNRLGLDLTLHVPNNLKLTGDNVQVSPGTPIGLGNINLRVGGDLSLYKDPGQPLWVTGSLDSMSGTYGFQGRRFDVDEASSINFHGDLNPEVFVSVTRAISGVETRVTITGQLASPELRLTSTPPLEASDILALIVFNTSLNDLSAAQQTELAVRAGTLAAGFLTAPLMSALQRTLGIDTFEIEPSGEYGTGPKMTVGTEIAPGLVARFSRQFGQGEYDEATVEVYLSKLFRIRATFSDAGSLISRSPFRRIERAGIDLLFLFSF